MYYIGQRFGTLKADEIADIARFCNENGTCHLFCIDDSLYEIRANTKSSVQLKIEKATLESWLSAHDYIGIKIATGRATAEEYASEIAEMQEKADRINELEAEIANLNASTD